MRYNMLVVDDDKNTANSLADLLRLIGHNVTVSFGPRSALFRLKESIPDLVFLDVNMPGVDGLEICRYIRRDPSTTKVPIVIISAHEEQARQQAAYQAGANYYIVKPAMIEDLEKAIAQVMAPRK
jgi:CheY-like chemotaxis protein